MVFAEVCQWDPSDSLEVLRAHSNANLQRAREAAVEALSQWTGPHSLPEGEMPSLGDEASACEKCGYVSKENFYAQSSQSM